MARVQPPAHQLAVARDTSSLEPRTYKVVYEAITQEKKKLHTGVRSSHPLHPTFPLLKSYIQSSFNRHPPPGFTFVLAGNPKLTARCKEYSRTEGRQIYTVSTSHKEAGTISQHVCRIGHHFASSIVTKVCNDLGVSITPSGHTRNSRSGNSISSSGTKKTVYAKPNNIRTRLRSKRNIHAERDPISQEQLNYEAKNALTDLFPKIPEQDLSSIISRAFKKGGKRVGNAQELSLQRRVQLAALAHIRHQYTNYDKLLRTTPRYHARAKIEETCLRLIVQWRGDGEGDESDIEQILREVIVISDDDSDHNYGTGKGNQQSRDSSVEIVSSQTIAPGARKFQISQKLSTGDHHTFELDKTPSGSHENTQGDRERKDHKRPSTKWSSRYRAFRDKYNKQGSQAEAHGQIHRHPRDIEQDRNPLDDYLSSPLIQYEVPSDTTLESPYPLIKLGSLRGPNPAKGLSANLQGQVPDRVDAIGKETYWEIASPMASPMDRRIAANIPDSEVPRESYNHPNTYRQLSQNYGQDDVLPAIEDPLRNLIGSPNKGQQEHRSHRMVQHVGQYAAKQIGVPSSGKHENRASISALQEAPSPPSRLRTSPNFATLDYGEQQRKRQRSQYEPIAISHRYDAARSGRSPPTSHSRGSDMPKPPRPYTEQSVQWQTPTQIDPQPYQLIRGGEPEYHLRELREPPGPSKYSSNIHNEIHDRRLFRPLQGGICPTQLQLPQYEKSAPQPPPRSPSAPCSSGVYRPALIGDDKCVAAWGGHPRHLRLGNDSVYKPQDSSLEGTSFHPYFELRGASSHESRHFVPRHYLNSVGDDDEFHSQSLNFQPESNRPSSRELLRLQPDADTDSWKNGPTLVLPSPRLGKPPANENLWDDIRVGQEIRQKKEVKYSHNGSIFGQANVLVPRRSSQAYVLAKKPSEMAGGIRGADREWASKSDRYYRESAIYVKQPAGNFHAVERNSRSQQDIQGPASDKEIIVID